MHTLKIKSIKPEKDILKISAQLDSYEKNILDQQNWKEFAYKPKVSFSMAYNKDLLFLKYYVEEEAVIALTNHDNGPVYKDSCVEFFVSPDCNSNYYNFEFNCIGSCLMANGDSRHNRQMADIKNLKKIIRLSSLGKTTFGEIKQFTSWDILLIIPSECFFLHPKLSFVKGMRMKANFYKCGDSLSVPHYITWNPIKTENPDYHRPEFFGDLWFE